MCLAIVLGTSAIPCIHPYFRKQRAGCTQQAQLIQLSSSRVCSTNFSRAALHPSPTSICESPARRSIFVHHAKKLVPLCQIFHSQASFRPYLSLAYQVCNHGWTQSGLPSGLNLRTTSDEFLAPVDAVRVFSCSRNTRPRDRRKEKKTAQGSSGNIATKLQTYTKHR